MKQEPILAKCSLHIGKKYNRKHNNRSYDKEKWNKDGHIDPDRCSLNVTIVDKDLREYFDETFGDALKEYNAKNEKKHPERVKTMDEYFKAYKGAALEVIMQIGDHEMYWNMVDRMGQQKADKLYTKYLYCAYEKWLQDNPSYEVYGAYIHMDEVGQRGKDNGGTPHLHLDVIPVSEQDKGMTVKVNKDGALKSLGYERKTKAKDGENDKYKETPFKRWLSDTRESYEDFAQKFFDKEMPKVVTILPSERCTRPHKPTWQHKAEKAAEKTALEKLKDFFSGDKQQKAEAVEWILAHADATNRAIAAANEADREKYKTWLAELNVIEGLQSQTAKAQAQKDIELQERDEKQNIREAALNQKASEVEERAENINNEVSRKVQQELERQQRHQMTVKPTAAHKERMRRLQQQKQQSHRGG